jgi:hypothetical protein
MRPALDSAGHRVPRTKPTCLLDTWRPHRRRPFALVLHLHQHQSSHNLHLQYLAKNQSTQRCPSLITPRSDHPPVLEPHMVLSCQCTHQGEIEDHVWFEDRWRFRPPWLLPPRSFEAEDTHRDRKGCVEAKQVVIAGHPSDGENLKTSKFSFEGRVSPVSK